MGGRSENAWRGENVLVTGATGLIGSHLVDGLVGAGAKVAALVLPEDPLLEIMPAKLLQRLALVEGRLEDPAIVASALKRHKIRTVFHLGAQTLVLDAMQNPLATFETNVRGTYNLLDACRKLDGPVERVVVASSDKAYGTQPRLPYTEDMPLAGRGPYDVSKTCTDLLAQSYAASFGLPVVIARCGNVFGGGDLNWSRLVPGTIRSLLQGERPLIRSDGTFVRDYLYVKDVTAAYLGLAGALGNGIDRGEAVNFSYEQPLSVLEMVRIIQNGLGATDLEPRILNEVRMEIHDQHLSADKARTRIGWKPRYTIEQGMQETIAWYRQYLERQPLAQPKGLPAAPAATRSGGRSST